MSRRLMTALAGVVVMLSMLAGGQVMASARPGAQAGTRAAGTTAAAGALPSTPEVSVASRLPDRREVAAGTRAYSIGFEDGRFYANGWHITGEMGGVWTPPLKLVDGVWFGLDGHWIGPATRFSSGWGYTRYQLPDTAGLKVQRTDFVPDGRRGALFGLTITNPGAARTAKLSVDAHSELMGQYPWGFTGVTPNASDNLPDKGRFDGRDLVFTDDGTLPGAPEHHYAALVGTSLQPGSGTIGDQFWGPQPGHRCTGTEPGAPAEPKPSQCDDGPFGRGTGGELTYSLSLPAGGSTTVWLAVAGSDHGLAPARQQLASILRNPSGELAAKIAGRERLARQTTLSLPGDRLVQNAIDWGKQNLADLTQTAREPADPLDQPGQAVPGAAGHRALGHLDRRRLPGLPVDLRHRRGVHRVRRGLGRPVRRHRGPPARAARRLRHPQQRLGGGRPRGGVRRLGLVRARLAAGQPGRHDHVRLQHRRDREVPQRRRPGLAVDRRQPVPRRDVRLHGAQPALRRAQRWTPTTTAGPRVSATSSAPGWARRSWTTPST